MILVDRSRETAKVVEQEENPVTPGLERVQPVLKARERLELSEEFEMRACDAVGIFRNNFDADCPEQIGPKGTMLPLASRDSVFGCRVMVVG